MEIPKILLLWIIVCVPIFNVMPVSVVSSYSLVWVTQRSQEIEKISESKYSQELQDAYNFAYQNKITTQNSIDKADMNWWLTRIAMAKMLSQYAINILWKSPDTSKIPNFWDVDSKLDGDYNNWVTLAYQLWIMWVWIDKFRPFDSVTRAEFWTALSRVLYWDKYEWGTQYYTNHLNALKSAGIMNQINQPNQWEIRWFVMLMLMRAQNNGWNWFNETEINNNLSEKENKEIESYFCKTEEFTVSDLFSGTISITVQGKHRWFNYDIYKVSLNSGLTISSITLEKLWSLDKNKIKSVRVAVYNGKYKDWYWYYTVIGWESKHAKFNPSRDMYSEYETNFNSSNLVKIDIPNVNLNKDLPIYIWLSLDKYNLEKEPFDVWIKIVDIETTSGCKINSSAYSYTPTVYKFTKESEEPQESEERQESEDKKNDVTLTVNNSIDMYDIPEKGNNKDSNYEIINFTVDLWEEVWNLKEVSIYNYWNINLEDYIDDVKVFFNWKDTDNLDSFYKNKKFTIKNNKITIGNIWRPDYLFEKELNFSIKIRFKNYIDWESLLFYIRDKSDIIITNRKWKEIPIDKAVNIWNAYAYDNEKTFNYHLISIDNNISNNEYDAENELKIDNESWEEDNNESNTWNWWDKIWENDAWNKPYCVDIAVPPSWKSYNLCLVKWDGSYFHMSVDDAEDLSLCSISKAGNLWESRSCNKTFTMLPASWTVSLQLAIKYNNESYTVQKKYDLDNWVFID